MDKFSHKPVLPSETIDSLGIVPGGTYADGTAGGGGHSAMILSRLKAGKLICIDQDPDAIVALRDRFKDCGNVFVVQANFSEISSVLDRLGIESIDGMLLDIGVSSHQLDTVERGFSYSQPAKLDMRMSQSGDTAADLVNSLSWQRLAEIFSRYGEEKFSRQIARAIEKEREISPVMTTDRLSDIIKSAIPAAARREGGHPAKRCFQALRIAVNKELDVLETGLSESFDRLKAGGRLSVISFHSLEDRIVKRQFQTWCTGCTCVKDAPVCVCGNRPKGKLLFKKPVEASPDELSENSRSKSAKLRTIIKL